MAHFCGGWSDGPSNHDHEQQKNAVLNQMLDFFLDTVEVEVIQSVLESCEYDFEASGKALQSISLKNVAPRREFAFVPQPNHSEHQRIQHANWNPAAVYSENGPWRTVNEADQTLERIHNFINESSKILVLMRGCPGSGKSYLAKELMVRCGGEYSRHVFSSDDHFLRNGRYVFCPQELQFAHKVTQENVLRAIRNGLSPVIVDNTNTQSWEMQVYVIMAVNHGYAVETLEPQTPWRLNLAQLVKRNVHNVPPNTIRAMLNRYEHGVTGEDIIKQLNLHYPPSKHPPQPATPSTVTQFSALARKSLRAIRSPIPLFVPAYHASVCESNQTANPECDNSDSGTNNGMATEVEVETLVSSNAWTDAEEDIVNSEFSDSNCKEASDKKSDNDCRVDQRQRWLSSYCSDAKEEASTCSSLTHNDSTKTDVWEASCSWDINLEEEMNGPKEDSSQRKHLAVSKRDASSNTNYQDFLLISKFTPSTQLTPGIRIVEATSRNINESLVNYVPPIPKKIVVGVSTMTDDECGSPVKGSLSEFLRMFPQVSLGNLETLLESCHGDMNWASNCLLDTDSGVRLDIPSLSSSETCSPEEFRRMVGPAQDSLSVPDVHRPGLVELNSNDVRKTKSNAVANRPLTKSRSQTSVPVKSGENFSLRRSTSLPKVASQSSSVPQTPLELVAPPTASCQDVDLGVPNETISDMFSETPKKQCSINPVVSDDNENKLSGTSDESETSSQGDDEMLEFVISSEFSQQLFCRFGGPQNKRRKTGLSPVLRLPESIACQIHYYLVLSQQQYYADDNEEEEQEQEEESCLDVKDKTSQHLYEQMCAEKALTIQEQEDMELATAIYELDLATLCNSKDTMATVLARRLLKDTFPKLDPKLQDELMELQGNSFHRTKEMIQEQYLNSYTLRRTDFPELSAPHTKTPSHNRPDISDRGRLRKEADGELNIARIYKQKAKEQNDKREWSAAAVYSKMATLHQQQYSKNMELTVRRVLANNMKSYCPSSLDLHYLPVGEALLRLDIFLDDHIQLLSFTPNVVKSLYIITGRGKHSSNGIPKIKPAVLERLQQRSLENCLENPGLVNVKVSGHSPLSHEC